MAAVLAGAGALALAQPKPPSLRLLAAIPLLFAVQQAAEGVVWTTIDEPAGAPSHLLAVVAFLAFALVVWPIWMPLALLSAETRPRRREVLGALLGAGVVVAAFAAWRLTRQPPVAHVLGRSLTYSYAEVGNELVLGLYLPAYVLAAVVPFFVSSMRRARLMGVVLVLSLVATFVIRIEALTSVWCFFAAIMTGLIMLGIAAEQRLVGPARPATGHAT